MLLVGTSYESNIQPQFLQTLNSILKFIWDGSLFPQGIQQLQTPYIPHTKCNMENELINFKELECMLGSSPIRWVIYDHEKNYLSFDLILQSGDDFREWVRKDDPMITNKCKIKTEKDMKILKELTKFNKLQKRVGRCGHGGHTQVQYTHHTHILSLIPLLLPLFSLSLLYI